MGDVTVLLVTDSVKAAS